MGCLRLETDLTYKITPDLRTLPMSPLPPHHHHHELNFLFHAVKGREARSAARAAWDGDSTQGLAWLRESTLPPQGRLSSSRATFR